MQKPTNNTIVRSAKRQLTEDLILNSAKELFATHGFVATTSKEIAKHAGVAEGLIFAYFKDKQSLFTVIITTWFKKNISELELLDSDPNNLANDLEILLTWLFSSYHRNLNLHKIVIVQRILQANNQELEDARQIYLNTRKDLIVKRLKAHQQLGHIKASVDITQLYDTIQSYAMMQTSFHLLHEDKFAQTIQQFIKLILIGASN